MNERSVETRSLSLRRQLIQFIALDCASALRWLKFDPSRIQTGVTDSPWLLRAQPMT